jgi:hypothetical protein
MRMIILTCMTTAHALGSICLRNTDTMDVDAELINGTSSASGIDCDASEYTLSTDIFQHAYEHGGGVRHCFRCCVM